MVVTTEARRILLQLLERRWMPRGDAATGRSPSAPGRFLRLHTVTRTGALGVALDRPRASDRILELGGGEMLLVDEALARAHEGASLDADARGGLTLRPAPAALRPGRPQSSSPSGIT